MKRLIAVLFAVAIANVAMSSDETLRRGIVGTYSRPLGMESTLVELRQDGFYVVTVQGCLTSEVEGRGRWSIMGGVLSLDRSGDRKEKRDRLSRFDIVVVEGDIALIPQDDDFESEDRDAEDRLFRHQKQAANQSQQPTAPSGRG